MLGVGIKKVNNMVFLYFRKEVYGRVIENIKGVVMESWKGVVRMFRREVSFVYGWEKEGIRWYLKWVLEE